MAIRQCFTIAVILIISMPLGRGQDADTKQSDLAAEFFTAATQFKITGGSSGSESFELINNPVLNWSNPERRTASGALYLWTFKGRPQVALCLYPTEGDKFDNELHSLSLSPLTAKVNGRAVWQPREPGIVMKPLISPLPVGKTAAARLLQMRNLAREFSANLVNPKRTPIPLRLLPTPIYRYPEVDVAGDGVDGAVFALVQATDPEVLIVIESIEGEDQQIHWQYGLARMSIVPTQLFHREELVWQTTWANENRSTPYFIYKNN